jgi:hypothetical protein
VLHARTLGTSGKYRVRFYRCPKSPIAGQSVDPKWQIAASTMLVSQAEAGDAQFGCTWTGTRFPISNKWRTGLYMARIGEDANGADVFFVVRRHPSVKNSPILVVMPFTTVQAYNSWGGGNFYGTVTAPQPVPQVSFLRPTNYHEVMEQGQGHLQSLLGWLDRNRDSGVIPPADYISDIDLARGDYAIYPNQYKLIISAGHDEYWSDRMVDNMLNFVWEGGNAAFLGANTCDGRVTFSDDYKTMYYAQGDRWSQHESKDILLVGLRTPLDGDNAQTNFSEPYTIQDTNHWAFDGVNDEMFGVLNDGSNIIGYEISSLHLSSPTNFEVLGEAAYNSTKNTQFGIFQNKKGMVFSAGTIDWVRGLSQVEAGHGVDVLTKNVVRRLSLN